MKIRVSQATRRQLDWMVAQCERADHLFAGHEVGRLHYTSNWAEGGPIIEREEIGIKRNAPCSDGRQWEASGSITAKGAGYQFAYGPTPLIAAMRCYVASKLGDTVDIPDELTNQGETSC